MSNEALSAATELSRCWCGSEAQIERVSQVLTFEPRTFSYARMCHACGLRGPFVETTEAADAVWNDLMKARPVAKWKLSALELGKGVTLGSVRGLTRSSWGARCYLDGHGFNYFPDESQARAWVTARVRAHGINVHEIPHG